MNYLNTLSQTNDLQGLMTEERRISELIIHHRLDFSRSIQEKILPEHRKQSLMKGIEDLENKLAFIQIQKRRIGQILQ